MITEEGYLKAKAIVEEYEAMEIQQATIEAMVCVSCQAFEEHDCFCDENPFDECSVCHESHGAHHYSCIYGDPLAYQNCGYG